MRRDHRVVVGRRSHVLPQGLSGHRVAGNVFFVSMLGMSSAGLYMALMKSQMGNVFGGALTFYLVATAWATARRREGETGIFDWIGFWLS